MSVKESLKILVRGTTEIIDTENLQKKLAASDQSGKPLVIKAGFDPTAPDIHLGHVVLLRKLRQFQDLGHDVYFLIGDFTAQVGDPTGRDQLRKKLSRSEIESNAQTYRQQVFKILDEKRTKVVFNSEWLDGLSSQEIVELTTHATVAQMLARADFKKRYEEGKEISILEFLYPLLQGYDSVQLKADVELGGNDQKFNLLMGRQMQETLGQSPQVVMMTPLLEGLDGVKKMSKSLDNYIGINEPPDEIFGKIMSVSDELMYRYFEFLTDVDLDAVRRMHPKEAKLKLAAEIVTQFYDAGTAVRAQGEFEKIFSQRELPSDMPEYPLAPGGGQSVIDILVAANIVASKKEGRRLLDQGAISFDGNKLEGEDWVPEAGVLKVGKRRFLKLL
ncbi:MAG: tyrosine--tRNA ligase [Candidatus Omnitrophica bacterium]|nr:tyrosine--tRNA ligase [Candidatus Omnitrophota bacterium]